MDFEQYKKFSEGTGVAAYIDSSVKMNLNKFGLYEENLTNDKINDSLNEFINSNLSEDDIAYNLFSKYDSVKFDKRIGFYLKTYVGHVTNEVSRANSSSGGLGTWILSKLLSEGKVDYVIHVKKNKNTDSDILFKYDISSTIEEICEGAKTRYYPVELSECLKFVKNNEGRYAIIGIPSFIKDIRLLQKIDPIIKERIIFTVGLICGHQKSSKFAESMAWQVGIEPGNLKNIDFRKKFKDKPSNSYGVQFEGLIDNEPRIIIKPTSELTGQNWGMGYFKRYSSDYVDDVFNETADIVLGDAWLKEYTNDSKGNNIIIVRNLELLKVIEQGIDSKELELSEVSKDLIFSSQVSHYRHTKEELPYRLYKLLQEGKYYPTKRVLPNKDISKERKKIQDLRMKISSKSHLIYQEAVRKNDLNYYFKNMKKYDKEYLRIYKINDLRNLGVKRLIEKIVRKMFFK